MRTGLPQRRRGPRRRGGPREGRRPPGPGHRYRDRWGLPGGPQGNGQSDGGTRLHTDRQGISTVEATCSAKAATRQAERRGVGAPAVWVRAGAYAPEVSPSDPCGGTREVRRLPSGGHGQREGQGPLHVRPGWRGAAGRPRSPDLPVAGPCHRRRPTDGGGAGAESPSHLGAALNSSLPGGDAGRFNPPLTQTPGICDPLRRSNPREPIR